MYRYTLCTFVDLWVNIFLADSLITGNSETYMGGSRIDIPSTVLATYHI